MTEQNTPALTIDDITVLDEALTAWVDKEAAGDMLVDMVTGIIPDAKHGEAARQIAERKEKGKQDKVLRREQAIVLQAKLFQMRDSLLAMALVLEHHDD